MGVFVFAQIYVEICVQKVKKHPELWNVQYQKRGKYVADQNFAILTFVKTYFS